MGNTLLCFRLGVWPATALVYRKSTTLQSGISSEPFKSTRCLRMRTHYWDMSTFLLMNWIKRWPRSEMHCDWTYGITMPGKLCTLQQRMQLLRHLSLCCITVLIYASADEADAYMFYRCFFVFLLFSIHHKIPDNRSRERLNGFS